ncbi:MAG: anthranilate synthase component I family protein, partial [Chloroflexi bacterium]|nr:anthranilate synthase component I family protein [Chloroflexota bacterium]
GDWGVRAGQGAYFDWLTVNSLLPTQDTDPSHTGIQVIDRSTVRALGTLSAAGQSLQNVVDGADGDLNPLGLARNIMPFDISPAGIDAGQSHFEQIYDRALAALNNAQTALDQAQGASQRLRRHTCADPFSIYRALRMINPSPYMFFLDFGSFQLIGSSPEMMVKLQDSKAETRPIAGTRPRGSSSDEDDTLIAGLLADPKERAEHTMLVDLGRNDIGRVSRFGSVTVPLYMGIEKYSHVIHIVSSVQGELRPEYNAFDLLRACFPAGTLSGAPKVRSMEIISELERTRRGPYGGAVGYFGFGGSMDTCITIRTIVMIGDMVYLQGGAGIVADSDPMKEYEETLRKIQVLEDAVRLAESWKDRGSH